MKFLDALALLSAASSAVASQGHSNHKHRHLNRNDEKRGGSPVENRAAMVTELIPGPTETVYQLQNGEDLTYEEVQEGVKEGKYVLMVEDGTTAVASTSISSATTTPVPTTSSAAEAAAFIQVTTSSSSSIVVPTTTAAELIQVTTSSSSSIVVPTTSSSTSVAKTSTSVAETSTKASSVVSSTASTATGISEDFPSGELDCSALPTAYGAVYLDWLDLDGWSGIQETPDYSTDDLSISSISEKTSGSCTANSFCSYACPEGYQKSQWPVAQGSLGQSVGGLYCNADGKLELSNTNFSTICIEGTGTISVQNTLDEQVVICRTDYPGYESETIPLVSTAGSTKQLTCPDASQYYTWKGSETSAQYYVNPKGATEAEACVWGSSGTDLGNWAPVNLGVGMDTLGVTYISLIPNSPTNPDGVLDFTITIKGDTSGTCYYSDGKYYDDDGENSSGCTVEVSGTAYYELS